MGHSARSLCFLSIARAHLNTVKHGMLFVYDRSQFAAGFHGLLYFSLVPSQNWYNYFVLVEF